MDKEEMVKAKKRRNRNREEVRRDTIKNRARRNRGGKGEEIVEFDTRVSFTHTYTHTNNEEPKQQGNVREDCSL